MSESITFVYPGLTDHEKAVLAGKVTADNIVYPTGYGVAYYSRKGDDERTLQIKKKRRERLLKLRMDEVAEEVLDLDAVRQVGGVVLTKGEPVSMEVFMKPGGTILGDNGGLSDKTHGEVLYADVRGAKIGPVEVGKILNWVRHGRLEITKKKAPEKPAPVATREEPTLTEGHPTLDPIEALLHPNADLSRLKKEQLVALGERLELTEDELALSKVPLRLAIESHLSAMA